MCHVVHDEEEGKKRIREEKCQPHTKREGGVAVVEPAMEK